IGGARSSHDGSGTMPSVVLVEAGNRDLGVDLATTLQPAADAWWYSIDTVSLSEDGYERTHQGSSLSFLWPLRLAPGETATFEIDHRITTSVDRAVEEGP
ncbi:MAG: alpha-amylase/4-alpha-glucanotransferase domain-containing protein, partial [Candidatus Limnocylindrales bacterium]